MTHLVCFSHHKGASRLFRFQIFEPLARHLRLRKLRYEAQSGAFVFRETEMLELHNVLFHELTHGAPHVVMLGNAGPRVVRALTSATADFRGVHALRDPRQIFVSSYFHHLEGHDIHWPGFYWEKLAEDRPILQKLSREDGLLYELDNISADILSQLVAWEPDERIMEVRVEDLTASPAAVTDALLTFLGITDRPALDVRNETSNPESQDWRRAFTPKIKNLFKDRYGELLIRLGYETGLDW